jgi:hypothetical protein
LGVSAPELVAWARLAPRFGQGSAAVALLRAYLAEQAREQLEMSEAFAKDADDGEQSRHPDLNAGSAGAAWGVSSAGDAVKTVAVAVPAFGAAGGPGSGAASGAAKASLGRQLEANMRFRLAGASRIVS